MMNERSDPIDVAEVAVFLRAFAEERDWGQFHSPKNLAMALAGEAGELLEIFQWLTPEESSALPNDPKKRARLEDELADIVQYAIRLADEAGINLNAALWSKLEANSDRFTCTHESNHGPLRECPDARPPGDIRAR